VAQLIQKTPARYDILAEAVTADGRVVKRVEARADGLADVAEAFRLARDEATKAHIQPARVRLTASRAGATEVAVTQEINAGAYAPGPLDQSALLDGKTKVDAPQRESVPAEPPWYIQPIDSTPGSLRGYLEILRQRYPSILWNLEYATVYQMLVLQGTLGNFHADAMIPELGGLNQRARADVLIDAARQIILELNLNQTP